MSTYEHNGVLTYKDENKNVHLLYPVTKKDNVEGMEVVDQEISDLRAFVGYTDSDIYGVEVDLKNKKFTRLAGAVGLTAGANFDKIKAFGGRRRCILSDDGVVLAYAGEAGYTESGALIQAVTVNGTTFPIGTKAQVMVEQPQFFYKVVPLEMEPISGGIGYHMRKARYYVSDQPKAGFKLHPLFTFNGVENPVVYLSAYEGVLWDNSANTYILNDDQVADFAADKLSSIGNAKPVSGLTQNLTRANARALAHNRGTGWEIQTAASAAASQILMLVEYASFNMQEKIGVGVTSKTDDGKTSMTEITGATTNLGNISGAVTNSNGFNVVTYRGEENLWGNIWTFVDGMNINAKGIHELYVADHDFADSKLDGAYQNTGITLAKTNGYVSAFGYNEAFDWLFVPSETVGNSSLPVGDYFWQNYTYNAVMIALLGAYWYGGLDAGPFYWGVGAAPSYRYRDIGARAVYFPRTAA